MASTTAIALDPGLGHPLDIPPPPPSHPFRLRRVWELLRTLQANPERTELALEIFDAVGGDGGEATFQRFSRHPAGQRLLREQPHIEQALGDRERLASLPEGSFGRCYFDFATSNGFAADGLATLNRNVDRELDAEIDPVRQWFWDRYSVCHDVWHVITGCSTTPDDECMLLAFSQAQTPQRGYRALLGMAVAQANIDLRFQRALLRAYRAGQRAAPLIFVRWEELLERPLDALRRELRVQRIEW